MSSRKVGVHAQGKGHGLFTYAVPAVSYTHLDVYKRQLNTVLEL